MHILITGSDKQNYIIKKSDIRRVYETQTGKVFICFNGAKNASIQIDLSVEDFLIFI